MDRIEAARSITELLKLDHPPVGIMFASERPDGVEALADAAPSACAMWRVGEKRLFYADAEAHFGCAVGALTMGFELPADVQSRLEGDPLTFTFTTPPEPAYRANGQQQVRINLL